MDILLTLVASVLLIIGFFVICQTSDDEEDDEETSDEIDQTAPGESKPSTSSGGNEQKL
jgi:hypothetical protein